LPKKEDAGAMPADAADADGNDANDANDASTLAMVEMVPCVGTPAAIVSTNDSEYVYMNMSTSVAEGELVEFDVTALHTVESALFRVDGAGAPVSLCFRFPKGHYDFDCYFHAVTYNMTGTLDVY
jgi:hypothetical protein